MLLEKKYIYIYIYIIFFLDLEINLNQKEILDKQQGGKVVQRTTRSRIGRPSVLSVKQFGLPRTSIFRFLVLSIFLFLLNNFNLSVL